MRSQATAGALPVKLTSFTAAYSHDAVNLEWKTAQEINASQFVIERSNDGNNFVEIGNVAAKGNTSLASSYNFTDHLNESNTPKLFYRLKMIDKDGTYEYSSVVAVNIKTKALFTISPNPAKNILNIKGNDITRVDIRGIAGEKLITKDNQLSSVIQINISNLSAGTYLATITTKSGNQQTKRFMVE